MDEYGTYVARRAILFNGVRAFNEGDAVPVSHVTREVVSMDDVVKVTDLPPEKAKAVRTPLRGESDDGVPDKKSRGEVK